MGEKKVSEVRQQLIEIQEEEIANYKRIVEYQDRIIELLSSALEEVKKVVQK